MSTITLTGFLGTTGLTDVGYRFINASFAFTGTRQTASVTELPGARGYYGINNPTIPSDATQVYWDSTGTAGVYAYEQLDYCMTRLLVDRTTVHTGAVTHSSTFSIAGATTLTGAVSFGSTFGVTGTTTLSTLITSGAVTFNSLAVTGTVTANLVNISTDINIGGNFTCVNLNVTTNLNVVSDFNVGGLATFDAGFTVNGPFAIAGAFTADSWSIATTTDFNGAVGFGSTFDISGAMQFANTLTVVGSTVFSGNLSATNASNDIRLGATERVNIAAAVWNFLTSAMTLAGSIGKALVQTITGTGGVANFTITVTDGVNPVQNVAFSLYSGTALVSRGETDAAGHFSGSGPLGTFSVSLYKPNFLFAGASRTITGNGTGTLNTALVITPIVLPTPPVSPDLCILFGYLVDTSGNPLAGSKLIATPVPKDIVTKPIVTTAGSVFSLLPVEGVSDGLGYVEVVLVRTSVLSHPVSYTLTSSNGQIARTGVKLSASTLNLNSL